MIRIVLRIFLFLTLLITLSIIYLGLFGIKTDRFNELIKSKIVQQDDRLDINLKDVYIKLNIKEKSFSINSKNLDFFILEEIQNIANVDILISVGSLIQGKTEIKKIIINSKVNKINNLLKFVRLYKVNVPILYLENSVKSGNIIYNIEVDLKNYTSNQIKLSGKITNTNLSVLGKEKFENINLNFNYKNNDLEITNLSLNYKNIDFKSEKIIASLNNNLFNVKGKLSNNLNATIISNFLNYNFKQHIDDKINLQASSSFEVQFNNKFKLKKYDLESKIDFNELNIKLEKINLNKYISEFNNKVILSKGIITFKTNNQNKTEIRINSKYNFKKNHNPRELSIYYLKSKKNENYKFNINLSENEIIFPKINFIKKKGKKLDLNIFFSKNKNFYQINDLKLFNDENYFILKNIKLDEKFNIMDFSIIEANFKNNNNDLNQILIKKNNKNINITSKALDIGSSIENNLKSSSKDNVFDIFKNFNALVNLDIKKAKLDNDYTFKNLIGNMIIKNNEIDKVNISSKFDRGGNFVYTKKNLDGKKVTIISSDHASPFVKKFDFIKGFTGGKLDFTSTEIKKDLSRSELRIYDFKLKDMPALTKLLSLASLQGIADLATGEGIRFDEFDMFFENRKNLISVNEIYALGPAISILMEGYVEKNKVVSLRGTLVPATTINKTVAKIPLLGNILVGEKAGEGVFGVSFKIKGPPNNLDTRVNPIKTLTPRFITRTLEKIKKTN